MNFTKSSVPLSVVAILKQCVCLSVASVMLCGATYGADTPSEIARKEQEKMRDVFYRHYTPYLKKYIKVYIAQSSCRYDFVNDAKMNDLADRVIQHAVVDFDKALYGSAFPTLRERSDVRTYLANFVAFSMIDAQSQLISETQTESYKHLENCEKDKSAIQHGYEELPKLAAKILARK